MAIAQELQHLYLVIPERGYAETQIMRNQKFIGDTIGLLRSQNRIGVEFLPAGMTEDIDEWHKQFSTDIVIDSMVFRETPSIGDQREAQIRLTEVFDSSSTYTAVLKGIYAKYFPDAEV